MGYAPFSRRNKEKHHWGLQHLSRCRPGYGTPIEGMLGLHTTHSACTVSALPPLLIFPHTVEAGRSGYDPKGGKEGQNICTLLETHCPTFLLRQGPGAHHCTHHGMDGDDMWGPQSTTWKSPTEALSHGPSRRLYARRGKGILQGQHVAMVTMDVQGPFDALLKNRLLHRMRDQGRAAPAIRMIDRFLSDRQVRVRLGMTTTSSYPVQCGTPQGSPLSPVLYTLYLAELMQQDTIHRFGYADDIYLYRIASTLDSCNELIARDIRQINSWSCDNKIAFPWR